MVLLFLILAPTTRLRGESDETPTEPKGICAIGIEDACRLFDPVVFNLGESRHQEAQRLQRERNRVSPDPLFGVLPATKEEVQEYIRVVSARQGIDPDLPLSIARCESGFRWDAKNKVSTASGVFQYLKGTWANTPEGKAGRSVFDYQANIESGVRHIAVHGTAPWMSSQNCWIEL